VNPGTWKVFVGGMLAGGLIAGGWGIGRYQRPLPPAQMVARAKLDRIQAKERDELASKQWRRYREERDRWMAAHPDEGEGAWLIWGQDTEASRDREDAEDARLDQRHARERLALAVRQVFGGGAADREAMQPDQVRETVDLEEKHQRLRQEFEERVVVYREYWDRRNSQGAEWNEARLIASWCREFGVWPRPEPFTFETEVATQRAATDRHQAEERVNLAAIHAKETRLLAMAGGHGEREREE
jgi:hypothetical protein